MKVFFTFLSLLFGSFLLSEIVVAQTDWPKSVNGQDGTQLKMYQWQAESFEGNQLKARAAFSILEKGKTDPVFGVAWISADAETIGKQVVVRSAKVTDIRFPGEGDDSMVEDIQSTIENAISEWGISFALSDLQSSLQMNAKQNELANNFNNNPPQIIYNGRPSLLVLIDGTPRVEMNSKLGMEAVINTPFTIVKNNGQFYLYGGKHWYNAPSATGPYSLTTNPPQKLSNIEKNLNDASNDNGAKKEQNDYTISDIIVSTVPAELIQTNGEADFAAVEGTSLLYVRNTDNDIFMDVNSQQYFVLLSGRWYHSKTLNGKWQYIGSDQLPADFAKIPEGSAKDNVLASVAGTDEAKDAVLNAELPQTAKVDRHSANADVTYDGNPRFEDIEGTDMQYAVNSPTSVILYRGTYYTVDNGVWFQSYNAMGPWEVAVTRPYPVALIPPSYPVYNMKYVYIYDYTPDYVYMGYTPGYLNTFIYGPTIVYGTGYYYQPWYGRYYYPRPYTWGFGMSYNPLIGWGFGVNFYQGWFNFGFGDYYSWGYAGWGGWWGPSVYRPQYCRAVGPYRGHGGYYGRGYYGYGGRNTVVMNNNINVYRNNNIYNHRRDVVTHDVRPSPFHRNSGFVAGDNNGGRRPTPAFTPRNGQNNGGNPTVNPSNNGRRPAFGGRSATPGTNPGRSTDKPVNNNGARRFGPANSVPSEHRIAPAQNDYRRPTTIFNGQRQNQSPRQITPRQQPQDNPGRVREMPRSNQVTPRQQPAQQNNPGRVREMPRPTQETPRQQPARSFSPARSTPQSAPRSISGGAREGGSPGRASGGQSGGGERQFHGRK